MTFLSFSEYSLFVIELIANFGGFLFGEGRKLSLFASFGETSMSRKGRQWFLFILCFLLELIPLNFDECFFLHGKVILLHQFLILLLVLTLQGMQSFDVLVQFLLLFLHSLMMHLMEISLFE